MTYFQEKCYAQAAASFVIVTQLCTRDSLDSASTWSIRLFALTIPLLVGYGISPPDYQATDNPKKLAFSGPQQFFIAITMLTNFLGFCLFFGHFGTSSFLLFGAGTVAVLLRGFIQVCEDK